jgi:hypothetical protein
VIWVKRQSSVGQVLLRGDSKALTGLLRELGIISMKIGRGGIGPVAWPYDVVSWATRKDDLFQCKCRACKPDVVDGLIEGKESISCIIQV